MWRPISFICSILIASSVPAEPNMVTFEDSGTLYVQCECLVAFPACQSEILSQIAGKPKQTWTQTGTVKKDVTLDLTHWCFRRRELDGPGVGICCTNGDEYEDNMSLFQGTFDEIR